MKKKDHPFFMVSAFVSGRTVRGGIHMDHTCHGTKER